MTFLRKVRDELGFSSVDDAYRRGVQDGINVRDTELAYEASGECADSAPEPDPQQDVDSRVQALRLVQSSNVTVASSTATELERADKVHTWLTSGLTPSRVDELVRGLTLALEQKNDAEAELRKAQAELGSMYAKNFEQGKRISALDTALSDRVYAQPSTEHWSMDSHETD